MSTTTTSTFCDGSIMTVDVPAETIMTTEYIKEQISSQKGNHIDTLCLLDPAGDVATARSTATEFAVVICQMPIHTIYEICVRTQVEGGGQPEHDFRTQLKFYQDGTDRLIIERAQYAPCLDVFANNWFDVKTNISPVDDAPVKTYRLDFIFRNTRLICEFIPSEKKWSTPCTMVEGGDIAVVIELLATDMGRDPFYSPNIPQLSHWENVDEFFK
jgi:hypothetical protein